MRTTHVQATTIRAAFENIKVKASAFTKQGAIIGEHISKALHGKAGITNELDWNAKLSMKTAQLLDAPTFNPTKQVKASSGMETISCYRECAWKSGAAFNKMCS
jgi:hypothetical protein